MASRISEERRKKFMDRLRWWAEALGKSFKEATKEDLEIADRALKGRQELRAETVNAYISMLKQFYKHIEGDDEEIPRKVRKLSLLKVEPQQISEDGETSIRIYKVRELEAMMQQARTVRDKCLVALSYDCGGRLDEVWSLRMRHVKPNGAFFKVYLHGNKTHKSSSVGPRWVSVYYAVPYVKAYLKAHPYRPEDADQPFWTHPGKFGGTKDGILSKDGFRNTFERIKERSGITGRRFHDLRHTKTTHLLRLSMPEAKVKKFMGWSPNSKQLGRYSHLVEEDVDEDLSRIYGLTFVRKKHDDIPIPIKCPKCEEVNEAGSQLCIKCNNPLSAKAITNATTKERYWKQKYEKESEKRLAALSAEQEKLARTVKWLQLRLGKKGNG